ncbi:hypothetical protein KTO58_26840 [Chitinophaga pendula]|uniref:hypothetical protein n=1 Tax=Chitinophaga TaxID=79328 RepID=UPI000BAF9B5A|nr:MULTISPECIES: hypothetical protein [Chitinophaga]ASZ09824.1 hypothetical protein CK934_01925 [Chitinophaga sp. MD30]UCJ07235.1 hypothetical protein KTO58_26840 [Chitinophaga pendula]
MKKDHPVLSNVRPQVKLAVVCDTTKLKDAGTPAAHIYMIDNRVVANGPQANRYEEGGAELKTVCDVNDDISWYVLPLNPTLGDVIEEVYFVNRSGQDVFQGNIGSPKPQEGFPNFLLGHLRTKGDLNYTLKFKIRYKNDPNLKEVTWDPGPWLEVK